MGRGEKFQNLSLDCQKRHRTEKEKKNALFFFFLEIIMLPGILEILLSNGSQNVVLMVAPGILSWEEPKKE